MVLPCVVKANIGLSVARKLIINNVVRFDSYVLVAEYMYPELAELRSNRCPFCGRHFTRRGLYLHLMRSGKRNYCAMIFQKIIDDVVDAVYEARRYVVRRGKNKRRLMCAICGEEFMRYPEAILHIVKEHLNTKKWY